MLSLALGTDPSTGSAFLSAPLFAALTAALWGYLAAVLAADARAKGLRRPWASLPDLLAPARRRRGPAAAAAAGGA